MPKIIAVVKLAQGHVAFYDEITRIHLTLGNSTENITEDMNLSNIKRAISNKVLVLVTGSLSTNNIIKTEEKTKTLQTKIKEELPKEVVEEVIEEVVEIKTEENTETEAKIKTTKKKKKKED